jgi:hypothetical protein
MLKRGFFLLRSRWPLLISSYISDRGPLKGAFDLLFEGQKETPQVLATPRGMTGISPWNRHHASSEIIP